MTLDVSHILAQKTDLAVLDGIVPAKASLVQLSGFLWQETRTPDERIETARHALALAPPEVR